MLKAVPCSKITGRKSQRRWRSVRQAGVHEGFLEEKTWGVLASSRRVRTGGNGGSGEEVG